MDEVRIYFVSARQCIRLSVSRAGGNKDLIFSPIVIFPSAVNIMHVYFVDAHSFNSTKITIHNV